MSDGKRTLRGIYLIAIVAESQLLNRYEMIRYAWLTEASQTAAEPVKFSAGLLMTSARLLN